MIDLKGSSIEQLLTAWGRWASQCGAGSTGSSSLGYKSFHTVMFGNHGGRGVSVDYDDEMMSVDRAMSQLKTINPFCFKLLKLRYLYGYSYTRLASKLSRDLPEYRRYHKLMCHKTAKAHVQDAQEEIERLL